MIDKYLFFVEEKFNIDTRRKLFTSTDNNISLSLYNFEEEDYEAYNDLGAEDYTFGVYFNVNEDVFDRFLEGTEEVITDVVASVYLINLPKIAGIDFDNNIELENLIKHFFLYSFDNNDVLFDNFLEVALENGWYKNKKEAIDIYNENEQFFEELYNLIDEDNFLIKFADKDNFFSFE